MVFVVVFFSFYLFLYIFVLIYFFVLLFFCYRFHETLTRSNIMFYIKYIGDFENITHFSHDIVNKKSYCIVLSQFISLGSTDIFNKSTAGGGGAFKSAKEAINKFKYAARVVTAVHRFRRGPLNTILNMPQEQAIQIVVENNIKNIERDKQSLHGCLSGIYIKN